MVRDDMCCWVHPNTGWRPALFYSLLVGITVMARGRSASLCIRSIDDTLVTYEWRIHSIWPVWVYLQQTTLTKHQYKVSFSFLRRVKSQQNSVLTAVTDAAPLGGFTYAAAVRMPDELPVGCNSPLCGCQSTGDFKRVIFLPCVVKQLCTFHLI